MSVLILKIIALTTMIIDHYGAIFDPESLYLRIIGRIAFPIFAFLLVEGLKHTSDVKRYGLRLLMFALISEFPFDFAFYGNIDFGHQNIFYTLFIGIVAMAVIDKKFVKSVIGKFAVVLLSGTIASLINADYGMLGILYIFAFYFTKSIEGPTRLGFAGLIIFLANFTMAFGIQQYSLIALIPLLLYNNDYGPKNKVTKWFFYLAYPLHLGIFAIINYIK